MYQRSMKTTKTIFRSVIDKYDLQNTSLYVSYIEKHPYTALLLGLVASFYAVPIAIFVAFAVGAFIVTFVGFLIVLGAVIFLGFLVLISALATITLIGAFLSFGYCILNVLYCRLYEFSDMVHSEISSRQTAVGLSLHDANNIKIESETTMDKVEDY